MDIASLKQIAKVGIGTVLSPLDKAILVNSYGRSGSTMLTKSIISSLAKNKAGFLDQVLIRTIKLPAWQLDSTVLRNGFIYKTHDYPPQNRIDINCYAIYIFSDPVNVVLSLLRIFEESENDEWMRLHFNHLKAEYQEDFYSIIDYDTLNFERHFDSWLAEKRFPVAFIRYENLWENQDNLGDFLDIPLQLPPYKERKAKKNPDIHIIKRLEKTYANLRTKVFNCKDFFVVNC